MSKAFGVRTWPVLVPALLGFGLNYGSSNQVQYLLPSVRALRPSLWTRDFVVTQTYNYHPVYPLLEGNDAHDEATTRDIRHLR